MSVFASIDELAQNSSSFWLPYNQENTTVLLQGFLQESNNAGVTEENSYILSAKFLIRLNKLSKTPEVMSNVEWKLIEPFIEENELSTRYGFTLGHKEKSKDFYVNSENELQIWLESLSSVGIMTGIKDSFTFGKIIGNGAFSNVYAATCIKTGKEYAIKVIPKQKITKSLDSLVREIRIMRKIKHPNIVNLYKVYESFSNVYLVLDYVKGGDLFNRIIAKKALPEKTVKKFSKKMLGVLDYLKSKEILHRDIKLENILLKSHDNDYDFKLADFGLGAEFSEKSTMRCGSPGYIAPEVLRKQPYGIEIDTFSVGIIIYILLSGKMPFHGSTPQKVLEKNRSCNICFHDENLRDVSKQGIDLVKKLTCTLPDLRITPENALMHKWFTSADNRSKSVYIIKKPEFKGLKSKSGEISKKASKEYSDLNEQNLKNLRWKLMKLNSNL
ncbi:unnamed protein product [Blepharisma stoltei]|uniref:Protein kinase domain-containing protein n=1 Tax=Blepharisma stoltei TaxID=1481888 RepID=A0AAU9KEA4_9CILI|nr:unnamed protein product [Blepharisma stoltei]